MSEIDGRYVKRGMWTNVSKGPTTSKVITTDTETGLAVIALLAVLSSLGEPKFRKSVNVFDNSGTAHLWHLIAFAYHQFRANGRPSDGLFRQQQVLLRTLPTPSSLMADSAKLWWVWRNKTDRVLSRILPSFSVALLCTIGSLTASISSSYIMESTDLEVLVSSSSCGRINMSDISVAPYVGYWTTVGALAKSYAEECYGNNTVLPERCRAFISPTVSVTVNRTTCPFSPEFCIDTGSGQQNAIALDSGLVDLNDGFGLNLPQKDRVKFRKRTTCGILPVAGHTSIINATTLPKALRRAGAEPMPGEELMLYHWSKRPSLGNLANITTFVSLLDANRTREIQSQ